MRNTFFPVPPQARKTQRRNAALAVDEAIDVTRETGLDCFTGNKLNIALSGFSTTFRKYAGLSPREFRAQRLEQQ